MDEGQQTTYLTAEGLEKLKKELMELKKKLHEISDRIEKAKELGDLSENAEYHEAKEDYAFAKGRVEEIEGIINKARIIAKEEQTEVVSVGSIIKVRSDKNKESEYTIVGSNEANPLQGRISNESPLAAAFLGRKKGERAEVKTPAGTKGYLIVEIR
ncbi:MAG: transcription elongation factor GreA [Candidatus Magasanikbacteria bacterium]|nr:transcription elongation factor GreA [Candidatus Magasanikbacteria bacterium]